MGKAHAIFIVLALVLVVPRCYARQLTSFSLYDYEVYRLELRH